MSGQEAKVQLDVEKLLVWAFRDELPKRELSAAECVWRDMDVSGPFGPVDDGMISMQRYAYVGLPHRDAEIIECAVENLPGVAIDWTESRDAIMGDLEPIADGVLIVGTIQASAVVRSHAMQGVRPKWYPSKPTCHATPSRNHPGQAAIVGECRGRNLYSTGSHCPLTWRPSALAIAQARAEYIAWWRGLKILSETMRLTEHVALPPAAPYLPWIDVAQPVWVFGDRNPPKVGTAPLKPQREHAGPMRKQSQDVPRRMPIRRGLTSGAVTG